MLLLYTMGCGRSRAASSTTSKDVENCEQKKSSLQQNNKSATEKQDKDSKKESFDQKKRKISAQLKNAEKKQSNENKYTENSPPAKIPSNTVNGSMVHENTEEQDRGDNTEHTGLSPTKTIREKPPPPPSMMLQTKMSNSQLEFFKMLDEKIEKGRDYSSEDERPYSIACK